MTTTIPPAVRELRTPPGPPRTATLSLLRQMVRDRLSVMSSAATRYGDAVKLPLGPKTLYFFNHPDHAKHVLTDNAANYHKGIGLVHARRALGNGLLTSEGELWREQRKTIQPVFQPKRIAEQADAVADEAMQLAARLRAHAGGEPLDIREEMTGLAIGVLGRSLLDSDLSAYETLGESFEAVQNQAIFEMMSLSTVPTWVPLPKQLRFRRARADLDRIVAQLAADRIAHPSPDGNDVISRLLDSNRRAADPKAGESRMRDELVTLLLAGHETTASTLSWTFHLLDRNPQVWERLHDEAVQVLGDRAPTYEDLHRLKYTKMVLEETMRLFPPVWILPRLAQAEDEIGGYHVPAGADVIICPYTMHRNPALWDEPERFDPERFDPDRPVERSRYAYLPFGAGPRFCVGNALGLMEATFVTAVVARELRLTTVEDYAVVPEPMLTIRVRGGLPMRVQSVR